MIKTIKHSGLEKFFASGKKTGIDPQMAKKLQIILTALSVASHPGEMDLPGLRLHPMKKGSKYEGYWAVEVSGNWRVLFKFEGTDVVDVNLVDYH